MNEEVLKNHAYDMRFCYNDCKDGNKGFYDEVSEFEVVRFFLRKKL